MNALLLALALVVAPQQQISPTCPETGWLLARGYRYEELAGIAYGSIDAWIDGFEFSHEGHRDAVRLGVVDGKPGLAVFTTEGSGEWVMVGVEPLIKIERCLYMTAPHDNGERLWFGVAPSLVDEPLQSEVRRFVPDQLELRRSGVFSLVGIVSLVLLAAWAATMVVSWVKRDKD